MTYIYTYTHTYISHIFFGISVLGSVPVFQATLWATFKDCPWNGDDLAYAERSADGSLIPVRTGFCRVQLLLPISERLLHRRFRKSTRNVDEILSMGLPDNISPSRISYIHRCNPEYFWSRGRVAYFWKAMSEDSRSVYEYQYLVNVEVLQYMKILYIHRYVDLIRFLVIWLFVHNHTRCWRCMKAV